MRTLGCEVTYASDSIPALVSINTSEESITRLEQSDDDNSDSLPIISNSRNNDEDGSVEHEHV
jgi:hypothetical protein